MIDFRFLSYFLVACEHDNLGAAAKELGIAPSTLSGSLKSLEADFGVSLFRKQGAGLSPRRLAHWLYRAALPLLLLENFACRRVLAPAHAPVSRIHIDIRLRFAFGHFRRALGMAIADTARTDPLVLVDPQWPMETDAAFGAASLDCLGFAQDHHIIVETIVRAPDPQAGEILVRDDPWMIVRRRIGLQDAQDDAANLAGQTLMVPAFGSALVEQISAYAHMRGATVQILKSSPGEWPQLLDENPGAAFLLPASALAVHLGVSRIEAVPLDPPVHASIIARTNNDPANGDPVALRFIARLRAAFDDDRLSVAFTPVLTGRRIRYFNHAFELGRVSAAARAAGVAQPALSQQLHKLEESIGTPLFDRKAFGLVRTEQCADFARAADLLEKQLRELEISGGTASLVEGGRLSLGVLPSVSRHGYLVSRITDAILQLRERYPAMRITVREAPNGTLQNWVLRGRVGLAIVETALSQMPRLALHASEELSVIVDPRHGLIPPGPIRLADLAKLPLVLPTALFGLRQLLDAAARDVGVEIRPKHEIDALTMLIALLAREPIATVLPASAVRPEILSRELSAHPIIEPTINRRLFVIYSADRSLTEAERDLVKLLRSTLANRIEPVLEPLVAISG